MATKAGMSGDFSYYKNRKIAVPGGGGFLGSRIARRLKDAGAEVFVPRTSEGIDFRDEKICHDYLGKIQPDIVINCAAFQGGIGFHKGREAEIFLDNVKMGLFLMAASQRAGVKKFVNVVAGCSYPGYENEDELKEENYWNGQIHESVFSYGFARKASVAYGAALKRQYNWNSLHLILANMYGPGEHFNPAQSKALAALLLKIYDAKKNNLPTVEIWGTGKPVRDWLYVEDGAEGILRAAEVYEDSEPLNIASGVGISIKDLAELIKKIIGWNGEFIYNTSRPDGALKKTFNVAKMKEKLSGWLPPTPLEKGIKETLAWLEKNYDYAIKH